MIQVLATIAGLAAFIALWFSVQQFDTMQRAALRDMSREKHNQYMALALEMRQNIVSSEVLLKDKDEYLSGAKIPQLVFLSNTVEDVLRSGAIDDEEIIFADSGNQQRLSVDEQKLNSVLMASYHRMLTANQLMDMATVLNGASRISGLTKTNERQYQDHIRELMSFLLKDAKFIKERLSWGLIGVEKIIDYHRSVLDSLNAAEGRSGKFHSLSSW